MVETPQKLDLREGPRLLFGFNVGGDHPVVVGCGGKLYHMTKDVFRQLGVKPFNKADYEKKERLVLAEMNVIGNYKKESPIVFYTVLDRFGLSQWDLYCVSIGSY